MPIENESAPCVLPFNSRENISHWGAAYHRLRFDPGNLTQKLHANVSDPRRVARRVLAICCRQPAAEFDHLPPVAPDTIKEQFPRALFFSHGPPPHGPAIPGSAERNMPKVLRQEKFGFLCRVHKIQE
jgi:hypothetical protein